jgi:hypothetical protein
MYPLQQKDYHTGCVHCVSRLCVLSHKCCLNLHSASRNVLALSAQERGGGGVGTYRYADISQGNMSIFPDGHLVTDTQTPTRDL